ncbi:MAG: MarR family winged helix-turn-helix transcriptional regulator [Fervidobacterium sp.]|uniref:MarR family winged helix-turn-helix transcriptional regulator n=1 Tax=Fervidobacterium sp. TaxID=1871331 RepID=UPI00404A36A1
MANKSLNSSFDISAAEKSTIHETEKLVNTICVEEILSDILNIITSMVSLLPEFQDIEDMSTTELYIFLFTAISDNQKDVSNTNLSKKLHISKSAVSVATKLLIKKGIIQAVQDIEDRRHSYLTLTTKGKAIFSEFKQSFERLLNEVVSSMNEDELRKLTESFKMLAEFSKKVEMQNL